MEVRRVDVGREGQPMMPIEANWAGVTPSGKATRKVRKMAEWAAEHSRKLFGLAISGPKSVMAPKRTKIRQD